MTTTELPAMTTSNPLPPLARPERLAQAALLLAFCFDWLFIGQPLGISVLVFAVLVVGALLRAGNRRGRRPARGNLLLLPPLFFFAAMAAVRSNSFLLLLNLAAVMLLLLLFANFYDQAGLAEMGVPSLFLIPTFFTLAAVGRARLPIRAALDRARLRPKGWRAFLPILRGLLLAAPILLVLASLLATADLIFAEIAISLWQRALPLLFNWSWHGVLIVIVGWLLAGLLAHTLLRSGRSGDARDWLLLPDWYQLGWLEAATVLVLVNALFGLFVWVQFTYFFGGSENIDLNGYTFSEYARRGFFEIVVVACLTFGLILTLNGITRRPHKREIRIFNGLSTVLVVLVIIMLTTAFSRMSLYEAAYGFTRLRIYSHVFMVWLGLVLLWLAGTLWRRPEWFAAGFLVGALGFIATLNLLNPDAFIARQNLARLVATGDSAYLNPPGFGIGGLDSGRTSLALDTNYLRRLSDDAIPVLVDELDTLPQSVQEDLAVELSRRRARYESNEQWRRWPAFHFGRYRAFQRLRDWTTTAGG